jgi:hypothetical protein
MYDVGSLVFVVHHSDVSAGSHVAVTTRRRRNLARKISGHGMLFSPQIRAEHSPLAELRFLVRRQFVRLSQSS